MKKNLGGRLTGNEELACTILTIKQLWISYAQCYDDKHKTDNVKTVRQ